MAWRNGLCSAVVVGLLAVVFSSTTRGAGQAQGNGAIKLNCEQGPCDAVARGRAAFNDGNLTALGGNGRACADCHMPSQDFQLSPAAARARFEALLAKREFDKNADDPLFRPVDADDFRVKGENAGNFSNLVDNGLVRVTLPLPPNVRLIDPVTGQPTDETTTDLFRAVMPVMNVAITGPDAVPQSGRPRHVCGSWGSTPTDRIGRVAISTTRGSGRSRSRPAALSSPTHRYQWNLRVTCWTISPRSSRRCSRRRGSRDWPKRLRPDPPRFRTPTPS